MNKQQPDLLITGATGMIGRLLVDALLSRDLQFRALVRAPDKAQALTAKPGVSVVSGDLDHEESLAAALSGVQRAFLLTNSSERAEAQQITFVRAAKKAGVQHIVKLSQLAARADSPVRFLRYHAAVEETIRGSGLGFTFLRPNLIFQAYLAFAEQIKSGTLLAPIGDARVSVVDARDIAAVAAVALMPGYASGRTLTLTGPAAVTHQEIAAAFARAAGREVKFCSVPAETFGNTLKAVGVPAWQAQGLLEDYAHYERGEADLVSSDIESVTRAKPRDLTAFANDHAAALGRA